MNRALPAALFCLWTGILLCTGCGADREREPRPEPRVEDLSRGNIEVTLIADPPRVHLDRDILMTLRITAPSEMEVTMPALDDRLQGFKLSGTIDEEPVTRSGKVTLERRVRITPLVAREYRIAPMAIPYTDRSRSPAEAGWFATRPLLFDPVPPIQGKAGKDIDASLSPVWIRPTLKTVLFYLSLLVALVAAAWGAWKLFRRVRRAVQLMRMSPRERALHELAELLAKDLIGKDRVKEFYLELTLIVRTYIERAHSVRAPEQTTEEFLVAVSRDPRFKPEVIRKLRTFLEAADLVKFADFHPGPESIDNATRTAREYVDTDAAESDVKNLNPSARGP